MTRPAARRRRGSPQAGRIARSTHFSSPPRRVIRRSPSTCKRGHSQLAASSHNPNGVEAADGVDARVDQY
eukprot:107064-Prymnesium_polylepis.1